MGTCILFLQANELLAQNETYPNHDVCKVYKTF